MHLRIPGLHLRSIGPKPVVSALLAALLATACGTPSPRRQLARHIDDAIATSRATVGVAILLPDGATFTRNDRPLPLLSVFKFPVALAVLDHMERTGRRLSDSLTVGSEWLVADTYSPMRDSLPATGGAVSLGGLLRYTVSQSDNIACDLLLDLVGGPAAVDEYLGSKGFPEITICADERDMHRDMANQRLNTARPSDISRLFERFLEGGLLSRPHTAFLRQLLLATTTGADKLRAGVDPPFALGHKTGSSDRTPDGIRIADNDAGFILMPDGRSCFITVLVTDSPDDNATNAAVTAQIARAVCGYLLGTCPSDPSGRNSSAASAASGTDWQP